MKARRSLISRIASVFRRKKTSEKTRKPVKDPKNKVIEALEGRIAPATLIDGSTVQFTEADGDVITITFSKVLFNKLPSAEDTITQNNLDDIFKFSSGSFITEVSQDLQRIDLTKVKSVGGANPANGISFTI